MFWKILNKKNILKNVSGCNSNRKILFALAEISNDALVLPGHVTCYDWNWSSNSRPIQEANVVCLPGHYSVVLYPVWHRINGKNVRLLW